MATEKILGIDLGTTNSACAILEAGDPTMILTEDNEPTIPSAVAFTDNNEHIVGRPALNQAVQNPNKTITSVKRYMGREDYYFDIGTEEYTPEEISSLIIQKLRENAEQYIGEKIEKAVITVPAYFNDRQREATKNAGEIAGLEVERVMNEPTAAAIAYNIDKNRDQKVLIADLGGGTFDVSVLELGEGLCEVIATDGIRHLGGDDWDKEIVDMIAERFRERTGINLLKTPEAKQRLIRNAEQAKIDLTTQKKTKINIPFITTTNDGPLHLQQELDIDTFENKTIDLRQRLESPIKTALKNANIRARNLDNVILVGGTTKMPQIKRKIRTITGREVKDGLDPREVVAKGAGIQGGIISGEEEDMILLDVTSKSIGIEVKGKIFEPLISKNTTIPAKTSKVYTTSEDNQRTVDIKVYQGEQQISDQNELLGEFSLKGIPPAEAGTPRIVVTFKINSSGIIEVSVEEKSNNNKETITIDKNTGLSDIEMEEMKEKTASLKESSIEKQEKIKMRDEADRLVGYAKQILMDEETDIMPSDAIELENKIETINNIMADDGQKAIDLRREVRSLETRLKEITENDDRIDDITNEPTGIQEAEN